MQSPTSQWGSPLGKIPLTMNTIPTTDELVHLIRQGKDETRGGKRNQANEGSSN